MLDLNNWTMGEVIKFEELAGMSITDVQNGLTAKAMAAAVYIEEHRKDIRVTFESVCKKPMSEITAMLESGSSDDEVKK